MVASLQTGAAIFAVATRITALDGNGFPTPGANSFTTDRLLKATLTPVVETGDDIAIKNAAGDISAWAKHGDMVKYGTLSIELTTPNPELEQILAGGVSYSDVGAALGLVTGLTVTGQTTLGTVPAGVNAYRVTQFNSYGETIGSAEVQVTNTGSTSINVLSGVTLAAGALGWRVYGRSPGAEQYLGSVPNIGAQTTSAASGTGVVTALSVTTLTKAIPAGTTFQITGDTNTPKIVFTTTAEVGVGAVAVPVTASQSVTITIAAAAIVPVFVDSGSITGNGSVPTADLTAGPGNLVGYQMPALGAVANTNGVSLEFFMKRYIRGYQDPTYPYWRIVLPRVTNFHTMPRDFTNANMATLLEGQSFENPNWGSGPFGDWQFDSTKMAQRAACGAQILPVASQVATQELL